jgi:hypothetical protein
MAAGQRFQRRGLIKKKNFQIDTGLFLQVNCEMQLLFQNHFK